MTEMKPISNGINNHRRYDSFMKTEYQSSSNNHLNMPSIPVVDSGHALTPKFHLRVQIDDNSELTKEIVNLDLIKGTVKNAESIDENFNPKSHFANKKMRKVWKWILLHPNNNENVIFQTDIILAKITNDEFYVIEGMRRIVALKKSDVKVISAFIIDYREVYNKILEYRSTVETKKQQRKNNASLSSSSTKFIKPHLKPTPILKSDKTKWT